MVTVTGSDVLSRYARRKLFSVFGEYTTQALPGADYLPFDDNPDSTAVRVFSYGSKGPDGLVVQPGKIPGSLTFQPPDGGHLTDGQVEFSRGDDNTPAPVILLPTRPTGSPLQKIEAWFKLTNDPKGSTGDDAISAYDSNANLLWTFTAQLISGNIQWSLLDNTGTARSFANTAGPRDEGWHYWSVELNSSTLTALLTADKGQNTFRVFGSSVWPYDPRPVAWLVIGGRMRPTAQGKQTNTLLGAISSMLLQYGTGFSTMVFGNPGVTDVAGTVASKLSFTTTSVDALVGGAVTPVTDTTKYLYPNANFDLFSRWNELARTVGGGLTVDPVGTRRYWQASDMRPLAVALTLDAEQDLSAPDGGWAGAKPIRPTRVTVTSPLGSFEVIDTATEAATGLRLEASQIDTGAGTEGVARSVAGMVLNAGGLRINSFGMDLTSTSTDKITAAMSLLQNQRMRVQNLPVGYMGVSYTDLFASGWVETYDADTQSCVFVFDTDPAEDYVEGYFDNAEYGRFGMGIGTTTVTGGTCLGTTATGTVIVTGVPLNNAGATYTLDLNWNGERVTASAAGGATSPQTLTLTARGVAPSVARSHVAGEPIEVYHALTFGP